MANKKKAEYSKPTSQVDLEERLANGNESSRILSTSDKASQQEDDGKARIMTVEGNELDSYFGVDPIYQNYANETDAPYPAESGPEAELEEMQFAAAESGSVVFPGKKDSDEDESEAKANSKTRRTSSN